MLIPVALPLNTTTRTYPTPVFGLWELLQRTATADRTDEPAVRVLKSIFGLEEIAGPEPPQSAVDYRTYFQNHRFTSL